MQVYVVIPSKYSVKETVDRVVIVLQRADMTIYGRIDRQTEAKWHSRVTRSLEFIFFDDPRISAPIFEKNSILALCFPVRMIAWEDETGRCWIAFKDPLETIKEFGVDRGDWPWPDLRQL